MSDQALIIRDDAKLLVAFTEEANKLKETALEIAALVGKVTNAEENEAAVRAQTEIQRVRQLAEKARTACKAPVLEFGKKIDATAKAFTAELDAEMLRVSQLVGDFQQLEQMKARAAEQARNEQLLQLEREKAAALANATSHEAADAIQEHFNNKAAATTTIEPVRSAGQVVKRDWEITVTDPHLLARCHPACVKIEPRISEIKEQLKLGVKIQGIRAEEITRATVRVSSAPKAIDV